jgi:hypothetical protein
MKAQYGKPLKEAALISAGRGWSVQRETERNGPEEVSFRVDNIELPSAPVLNDATSLLLQLSHSHQRLSLGALEVRDLNPLVINQLVMIVNEVEVAAHPWSPTQSTWLETGSPPAVNRE